MKRILIALTFVAALVFAQAADPALEGNWTVIAAQHGGKPMDGLSGGTMMVKADRFEIHTASGSLLKGQLKVDASQKPARMALLHDSGLRWEAIYEAGAEDFRLNYIDASGTDKLPTAFRTSSETEATLIILKRATP
jgi:uncharacterized protein (TIGR03067 family)